MNKPITNKQLDAMALTNNTLVKRLVEEVRAHRHTIIDLRAKLAAPARSLEELERARPDRETVLVTIEPDGWTQVYGAEWIGCYVLHLPNMANDAAAELAETMLIDRLPLAYKQLWNDGKIIATGNASRVSASSLREAERMRACIAELNAMKEQCAGCDI